MKIQWHGDKVMKAINTVTMTGEERIARLIARDAKATTVFKDISGTLRNSIRYTNQRPQGARLPGWFVLAGGRGSWGDAWYAPKVELGWGKGKARPRPFMKTAGERNKSQAKSIFKALFGSGAKLR